MHEHVNGISRRDLFKFGGIAAAGVVGAGALASCAPQGAGAAGSASAASTTDEATTAAGHLRTGMPSFLTAPEAIADDDRLAFWVDVAMRHNRAVTGGQSAGRSSRGPCQS